MVILLLHCYKLLINQWLSNQLFLILIKAKLIQANTDTTSADGKVSIAKGC